MRRLILIAIVSCLSQMTVAQAQLVLELVEEHYGMVGDVNLGGYTTYRLYLEPDNVGDVPLIVYGHESVPLEISTSTTFYQDQFGSVMGGNIQSAFFEAIPSLEFDSWLTIGRENSSVDGSDFYIDNSSVWSTDFEAGNSIVIDDEIGGGIMSFWQFQFNDLPTVDGLILLAQFTTDGNLWGTLNLDYVPENYSPEDVVELTGLTFGSPDEMTLGCTDPDALNYDPEAVVNDGCTYEEGDLNGDGEVNVIDILDLLGNLGCTEDCGPADVNGDGVVNIWDLLEILGLIE